MVPRTIYSNSERSEQFLLTECFFNLLVPGSFSDQINYNNQNSNWKKNIGIQKHAGKVRNCFSIQGVINVSP